MSRTFIEIEKSADGKHVVRRINEGLAEDGSDHPYRDQAWLRIASNEKEISLILSWALGEHSYTPYEDYLQARSEGKVS